MSNSNHGFPLEIYIIGGMDEFRSKNQNEFVLFSIPYSSKLSKSSKLVGPKLVGNIFLCMLW